MLYFTLKSGIVKQIPLGPISPTDTINQIHRYLREFKNEVEFVTVCLEVPEFEDEMAKHLIKNCGVRIRKSRGGASYKVEFTEPVENFEKTFFNIFASIKLNESLLKLNEVRSNDSGSKIRWKARAQNAALNGRLDYGCPLIKRIAKTNFGEANSQSIQMTLDTLQSNPKIIMPILANAYKLEFGEDLPGNTAFNSKYFTDSGLFEDLIKKG